MDEPAADRPTIGRCQEHARGRCDQKYAARNRCDRTKCGTDALLRQFADTRGFWDGLLERAGQIELGRPLHYALVFAARLLGTPVPPGVLARAAERFGPAGSVDRLMGTLVASVLDPDPGFGTPLARWLLYVRSHWLRMPPRLLSPHLARNATRRLGVVKPSEPVQTVLGSPDGQGISGRSDGS